MARLMPARVGRGAVDHGVEQEGEDGPEGAPQGDAGRGEADQQAEPDEGVAERGAVAALEQRAHLFFGHGREVPAGVGQPLLHCDA